MNRAQNGAGCLGCLVIIGISLFLWFLLWLLAGVAIDVVT